jgi:hypothetical protein
MQQTLLPTTTTAPLVVSSLATVDKMLPPLLKFAEAFNNQAIHLEIFPLSNLTRMLQTFGKGQTIISCICTQGKP